MNVCIKIDIITSITTEMKEKMRSPVETQLLVLGEKPTRITCVKLSDLSQPKAGTSCKQNDLAKLRWSVHTNGPELTSARTIHGTGATNMQGAPAYPVTQGMHTNSVAMNDHHCMAQHKSIWKVKICEAKIQPGKWHNAYQITGFYLLVPYYCIWTDLGKAC